MSPARRGLFYEAYGPVRLGCGHEHPKERGALECVRADQSAQAELGLSSDREVCAVDKDGTRRPIWPMGE